MQSVVCLAQIVALQRQRLHLQVFIRIIHAMYLMHYCSTQTKCIIMFLLKFARFFVEANGRTSHDPLPANVSILETS